ncbi:His Kinase A (phospho-acceptor) domain-containing protein [Amphibacillus marinus]|uniref:histidine kinase n=1 Tax=Amphibacillus marinus TaxID=872970 RepID=A0A1H8IHN3_9BACI|nr:HAMP domain-containing histidine kinase [Amphibacillus marinus]SEN67861.1 His Kinase A (phospho-acceptor) domain-containing protein [Amphibacillus marinus]
MTLKGKTVLTSITTFLLFLIIVFSLIYFSFRFISVNQEMSRIVDQTDIVMEALASDEGQGVDAIQLLRAYLPTDGMIRIIGPDGAVIQAITKEQQLTTIEPIYRASHHQAQKIDNQLGHYALVSRPIIWSDGSVVTLEVVESLEQIDEVMETLSLVLFVALLIMVIPAWLAGKWIGQIVIKPIGRLNAVMQENQQNGQWKDLVIKGKEKDEIVQLGLTYNEMNGRIKDNFLKQKQFVADASHELKTPLAIIKSYAQLIKRQGQTRPEVLNESVQAIEFETNRMDKLIQQMLALATLDRADKLKFESVDIAKLCREIVRSCSLTYNRTITFESDQAAILASVDREKIKQVLYILLDNAQKYSEQPINVVVQQFNDCVKLSVSDFGEGIPAEEQAKIFNRFYRIDKARSRGTGGSGLGLAIAHAIIAAHGGELAIESEVGKGSTFSFTLRE